MRKYAAGPSPYSSSKDEACGQSLVSCQQTRKKQNNRSKMETLLLLKLESHRLISPPLLHGSQNDSNVKLVDAVSDREGSAQATCQSVTE